MPVLHPIIDPYLIKFFDAVLALLQRPNDTRITMVFNLKFIRLTHSN